jgi:hypothetical protein
MIKFLKKIVSKAGGWVLGALGLAAFFKEVGTIILIIVVIFLVLYAVKVFKK